eukprot:TRINITY_DN1698_c1_g2_i2.p1 TRINITY_DN1698_c1_g2~~TRINITY_DN1698_c1_g2_i2.p1  ORF type:complete len:805 (-),score=206.22 TRINITY_DN1698_c1_g2_i2:207-2405(-)
MAYFFQLTEEDVTDPSSTVWRLGQDSRTVDTLPATWTLPTARSTCAYLSPSGKPCGRSFVGLRGYHPENCRVCGDLFCFDHCCNMVAIPKEMPMPAPLQSKTLISKAELFMSRVFSPPLDVSPVCNNCLPKVRNFSHMLARSRIPVNELRAHLSTETAARCVLSVWRRIQYRLPSHTYSQLEKDLLWTNRFLLVGHGVWLTHLILSLNDATQAAMYAEAVDLLVSTSRPRVCTCQQLTCTTLCCAPPPVPTPAPSPPSPLPPQQPQRPQAVTPAPSDVSATPVEGDLFQNMEDQQTTAEDDEFQQIYIQQLQMQQQQHRQHHRAQPQVTASPLLHPQARRHPPREECEGEEQQRMLQAVVLHPSDALLLLSKRVRNPVLRSFAARCLSGQSSEMICALLPVLVHFLRYEVPGQEVCLMDLLVGVGRQDREVLVSLYYGLSLACSTTDGTPHSAYYRQLFQRLLTTEALVSDMYAISLAGPFLEHMIKNTRPPPDQQPVAWCVPTHPHKTVVSVAWDKVKVMPSAQAPRKYECTMADGTTAEVLSKGEDLRRDQLVASVIRLMRLVLAQYLEPALGGPVHVVCYRVVPLTPAHGLIEIVPDASTLGDIASNYETLTAYITFHQRHTVTEQWQQEFANSLAAYTMITYLLGIGDRHADNLMIHQSGAIFHIDYGFVLGQNPASQNGVPCIRLTPDMLDVIGGKKSMPQLQILCKRVYQWCVTQPFNVHIIFATY